MKNFKLKNYRRAQGVVESVFAVGILALLLGGVVILIVFGVSNRRASFDRRRATELASIVIENLIAYSQNRSEEFWQFKNPDLPINGYDGYTYSIGFTNVVAVGDSFPNCGIGKTDCAEVVVGIGWSGKNPQTLYFNRFFSKND
ncbi:MAG: hypothetical protein WC784_00970 [Candidatus Shapirobacteria bacterium]|jgi:hypothetical protein